MRRAFHCVRLSRISWVAQADATVCQYYTYVLIGIPESLSFFLIKELYLYKSSLQLASVVFCEINSNKSFTPFSINHFIFNSKFSNDILVYVFLR